MMDEGLKAGTDLYFNKNRLSGLWGPQTPLGLWLQENEMTTLFFGGVNADQCVWSTLIDAYFKVRIESSTVLCVVLAFRAWHANEILPGYDVIYVSDISATTSPEYATQMVLYNGDGDGRIALAHGFCS